MTIWVDLDGVLVDIEAAFAQRGIPLARTGPQEAAKWRAVSQIPDFFLRLPWTPWGREMWGIVNPAGAHILTAVAKSIPTCAPQKILWCRGEMGLGTDRIVTVLGKSNKVMYCCPGDILLDDTPETIEQWNAAGGLGMLVTGDTALALAKRAYGLWLEDYKRDRLRKVGVTT